MEVIFAMTENERIKAVRKDRGLTLDEFGARIGVKKSALSQIENGKTNPSDQTRRSICREFGVNEEWLRTGEGEPYEEQTRNTALEAELRGFFRNEPDEFRERLIRLLLRLPPDKWDALRDFALELAAENDVPRRDSAEELGSKIAEEMRTGGESSALSGADGGATTA